MGSQIIINPQALSLSITQPHLSQFISIFPTSWVSFLRAGREQEYYQPETEIIIHARGKKFMLNVVFSQGIQFLIENELLKNTCEDIAQFLYKGEGLNKTAIGDYLGER